MKLIAKKPCSFGGEKFYIGDEIPVEYVINPKVQEQMGVLAIIDGDTADIPAPVNRIVIPDVTMSILVHTENGDMELEPTDEGIQDIFTVLIGTASEAEAVINEMTNEDALILLHMADSRKTVKAAAEARAKALREEIEAEDEENEGEQ